MKIFKIAKSDNLITSGWILSTGEILLGGYSDHEKIVRNNLSKFNITKEEMIEIVSNTHDSSDAIYQLAFSKGAIRFAYIPTKTMWLESIRSNVYNHVSALHKICVNNSIKEIIYTERNNDGSKQRDRMSVEDLYRL